LSTEPFLDQFDQEIREKQKEVILKFPSLAVPLAF